MQPCNVPILLLEHVSLGEPCERPPPFFLASRCTYAADVIQLAHALLLCSTRPKTLSLSSAWLAPDSFLRTRTFLHYTLPVVVYWAENIYNGVCSLHGQQWVIRCAVCEATCCYPLDSEFIRQNCGNHIYFCNCKCKPGANKIKGFLGWTLCDAHVISKTMKHCTVCRIRTVCPACRTCSDCAFF